LLFGGNKYSHVPTILCGFYLQIHTDTNNFVILNYVKVNLISPQFNLILFGVSLCPTIPYYS